VVALSEQALWPGRRWPRRWGVAVAGAVVVASLALGWLGGGKGGGMPAVVAPAARTAGAAQATNTAAHAANAAVPDTSGHKPGERLAPKKASLAAAGTLPPSGASPAPSGPTFDAAALPPEWRALLERTQARALTEPALGYTLQIASLPLAKLPARPPLFSPTCRCGVRRFARPKGCSSAFWWGISPNARRLRNCKKGWLPRRGRSQHRCGLGRALRRTDWR